MQRLLTELGLALSAQQLAQLWRYHQLLRRFNPELNLTRIHNFTNMVLKLYADSLLPALHVDLPTPLLDLGTGPGLPGIPLKIFRPELHVILAESRKHRVDFLKEVLQELDLQGIEVVGGLITPAFERQVAGVITRAVERMPATLERIQGCLAVGGRVVFMKGPNCDDEIQEVRDQFTARFTLIQDLPYRIGQTPHQRRLVVLERCDAPPATLRARAAARHPVRLIASAKNPLFKDLKKLLTARGLKKAGQALVAGARTVSELLAHHADLCQAWISPGDGAPPPAQCAGPLEWIQLEPGLFRELDVFGTGAPLLRVATPAIVDWQPSQGFVPGCNLLLPFQDPENVGAAIRSARAFGVSQIILLAESAHPFLPKAIRASAGTVFGAQLAQGPFIHDLPDDLPMFALDPEGQDIATLQFPAAFGLLAGLEGPGLPHARRAPAIAIPTQPEVESLNAATATAIALYAWYRQIRLPGQSPADRAPHAG